jgi:hypothetical protein
MRPQTSVRILVLSSLLASAGACSARHAAPLEGEGRAVAVSKSCDRSDQDSTGVAHVPLHRACAVDVQVRPLENRVRPDFQPPSHDGGCYSAMLEIFVDTSGAPEPGSARVMRTNNAGFAGAVLATIPTFRFTPARLGGTAVRQIFEVSMAMTTHAGSRAAGPPAQRRPPCM